ncbi:MAG: LLM class flavin-dependent oxidoreductase [Acidimicrobiia bacterium]|jgi:alkanesulfonate monooxygenase SsuD/methylene tetrahydromethanopterin reductase-like flavin-dependent oxidoreductase (luciferase family)
MDIAMTLPTMVPHDRADTLAWCRGIDEGPWSSLAVPERITFPSHSMIVELAAAAALTERVRIWTTIVVLPAHNEVEVAKQMASVDQLSSGRLTLGVGVGGREDDYRAIGGTFARRWSRMDEQVATMRRIWAGEPPFPGADPVGPPPVQDGGPPLIAGALGPKAIGRAARWADGVDGAWTLDGDEAAVRGAFELIETAWAAAGRADTPHLSTSIWYALGPDAEDRLRQYAYDYLKVFGEAAGQYGAQSVACFTPEALRAAVDGIRAAGAHELFLVPTTGDPAELDRTRDALGI